MFAGRRIKYITTEFEDSALKGTKGGFGGGGGGGALTSPP